MRSTPRRQLLFLTASVLVMLILFFISVRRSSEDMLPAIPTVQQETSSIQTENLSPAVSATPSLTSAPGQPTATSTQPLPTLTATRNIDSQATAQQGMARATQRARAMSDIVQGLYEDGSITSAEGSYNQLEDISISFNKPGYYSLTFSEFQALNFVLRANVLYDNAGEEISYPTAGCGFIFGYQEMNNQNRIILTLDGNVRVQNITGSITVKSTPEYYGELDQPAGHVNLILAVDQGWITMYVNNTRVSRVYSETLTDGWVGYAVEAGSSYDFGTICEFKDIELWHLEQE